MRNIQDFNKKYFRRKKNGGGSAALNFASVFFKLEKLRFSGERSLLTSTFMIGAFKISSFDDQFYIPSSKTHTITPKKSFCTIIRKQARLQV